MPIKRPRCQYCDRPAELTRSRFGAAWQCHACDARVGCHRGSLRPKGTLANAALRAARIAAHGAFDPLWQRKLDLNPQMSRTAARGAAYRWLASQLSISVDECHIAMFTIEQCMAAVEVCARVTARWATPSFSHTESDDATTDEELD